MVAVNILGARSEANYEAVPRVVFTDPQAGSVGAGEGKFSATARIAEVAKTAAYTRAWEKSNVFLTLLSDGERLIGAYALVPLPVLYDTSSRSPRFPRSISPP